MKKVKRMWRKKTRDKAKEIQDKFFKEKDKEKNLKAQDGTEELES